jgi:hypothetical protein
MAPRTAIAQPIAVLELQSRNPSPSSDLQSQNPIAVLARNQLQRWP